ncbi:MAG: AAA family ATPase [Burkholderiaceae bacterium]
MYLEHFALAVAPFSIAPDPAFTYPSRAQQEAHATLLEATDRGEVFVKVTGEVGTGKTLTCRRLLAALTEGGRRCDVAYIANPCLTPRSLLVAVGLALKLAPRASASEPRLLAALDRALLKAADAGRRVVVCLDEAQAMPPDALEALCRLAERGGGRRPPVQVVLFGQPELDARLRHARLRALASRITAQYRLTALSAQETEAYLAHRLRVAGRACDTAAVFPPVAAARVHRYTRGVPRLVNVVAHKSLLLACRDGAPHVGAQHVRAAAADTPYARPATALSRLIAWWQQGRIRQGTQA